VPCTDCKSTPFSFANRLAKGEARIRLSSDDCLSEKEGTTGGGLKVGGLGFCGSTLGAEVAGACAGSCFFCSSSLTTVAGS